jgi:hypothetical protein
MNRRVLKPLLASAVVLIGAFLALITLTPSNAATQPVHRAPASASPEGPPASTETAVPVTVESPRGCGDCTVPGADETAPRPDRPVRTPSPSIASDAAVASQSSVLSEPGA